MRLSYGVIHQSLLFKLSLPILFVFAMVLFVVYIVLDHQASELEENSASQAAEMYLDHISIELNREIATDSLQSIVNTFGHYRDVAHVTLVPDGGAHNISSSLPLSTGRQTEFPHVAFILARYPERVVGQLYSVKSSLGHTFVKRLQIFDAASQTFTHYDAVIVIKNTNAFSLLRSSIPLIIGTMLLAFLIFGAAYIGFLNYLVVGRLRSLKTLIIEKIFSKERIRANLNEGDEIDQIEVVYRSLAALRQHSLRSARKIANDAEKSTIEKARYLYTLAHELRSPLDSIMSFSTRILNSAGKLDTNQTKCVEIIRNSGMQLSHLVNDIFILSEIDSGEISLDFKPVNVTEICRQLGIEYKVRAERKGLSFHMRFEDNYTVLLDAPKVRQAIANLLDNAVKYTQQGAIDFTVDKRDTHHLAITVRDTGVGIEEADQHQLFSRFNKLNNAKRLVSDDNSPGLGLAIVHELIRLHKGVVEVLSVPGKGSCFIVILPLAREEPPRRKVTRISSDIVV